MPSVLGPVLVFLTIAFAPNNQVAALRCTGHANQYPVVTAAPVLDKTVRNGKRYVAGNGTDTFYVQHLYGSYYSMGYAHGSLFKDIIPTGINQLYDWIEGQVEQQAPWMPAWLAALIADIGAPLAFAITYNDTRPFTPQKYIDEMRGIADGAGVAAQDIFNVNMIAETIKAQCSIIGANGPATMNSLNGTLVHLRTLDGMGGSTMPIKDYAVVTVYHPDASLDEPAYANFAWASFVGTVTGFGQHVGVGEKFWEGQNSTTESTRGEAWTFVNRDILSSKNFTQAISRLQKAHRTCAVRLGIGSRESNSFAGAQVDAKLFELFNDSSINYPEHPAMPGLVYWDKYSQPTQSYCFPDLFQAQYGSIDAAYLALTVAPTAKTGSLHAVIYDYNAQMAYFSNARKTYTRDGPLKAYNRQFTLLDMGALFRETL